MIMVSHNPGSKVLPLRNRQRAITRRLCSPILAGVLALGGIAIADPASAATSFDGDWSVVFITRRGDCDPSVRYGVQITDGILGAASVTVAGRVSAGGAVRATVRSGSQWASGSGHLGRNRGSGVWRGNGSRGLCSGVWTAERRGNFSGEEAAPGTTIAEPAHGREPNVAFCQAHFKSFDPATATYVGFDGVRHACR